MSGYAVDSAGWVAPRPEILSIDKLHRAGRGLVHLPLAAMLKLMARPKECRCPRTSAGTRRGAAQDTRVPARRRRNH